MTLYILFAGLGTLLYVTAATALAALAGSNKLHIASGFRFAVLGAMAMFLATAILVEANRLLRGRSSPVVRRPTWNMRVALATVFFAAAVGLLVGATRAPAAAAAGSPPEAPAAIVDDGSVARAVSLGRTLFDERGCSGCHRSDGTGAGPSLHGRFGSPVEYPGSAAGIADESYIRESILTPTATMAPGFPPVMPAFAGRVTEEELSALVLYVQSLSGLAH